MITRHQFKRTLLILLIGSVVVFAVLGIWLVLAGSKNWFELRVLLTTIVLAAASLCGLACDASRTPRGMNLLPKAGFALTAIGALMHIFCIWVDRDFGLIVYTATVSIFAVATVHVCLLSIARLAPRYRWIFYVACQVIYALAVMLVALMFGQIKSRELLTVILTLSIIDVALTFLIPLLHRVSKLDETQKVSSPMNDRNVAAIDEELAQLRKRISHLEKLRSELAGREFEAM